MAYSISDRYILITGATDGIGKHAALELARMGANILVHGRNADKGAATLQEIQQKTGNQRLEFYQADLSSQKEVYELAQAVLRRHAQLEVLIHNAGVYMPTRQLTQDGLETTFAVNVMAPFLLTRLLMERMIRSAPARIIFVTSSTHLSARVDWNNMQGERYYNGYEAYALSKLGDILLTFDLARKLKGSKLSAICLDPGVVNTKLLRQGWGSSGGIDPHKGAETPVYLASAQELESANGQYFRNRQPADSSTLSYDRNLQEQFWDYCEKLIVESHLL